jgi:hypothetical protein
MGARNKVWRSSLAQELLRTEGGATVEEAALHLVDKKLAMLKPLKPPIDLKLVASIMNIQPQFNYVEMQEAARIIEHDGKHYVHVNKKHPKPRQRFSIAHEIAHKMLAGKKLTGTKARDGVVATIEQQEEEELCDLIAGLLVGLRQDILLPIMLERGFSFDTIDHVANKFETSVEATARALMECLDGRSAILYCSAEESAPDSFPLFVIKRYYSTVAFPVSIPVGQRLPRLHCVNRAFLSNTLIKTTENISFNGANALPYQCEARKMPVYSEGTALKGVVLLIKL